MFKVAQFWAVAYLCDNIKLVGFGGGIFNQVCLRRYGQCEIAEGFTLAYMRWPGLQHAHNMACSTAHSMHDTHARTRTAVVRLAGRMVFDASLHGALLGRT